MTTPTTNVPLPTFSATGLVINSEQSILTGMLADYVQAFAATGKTLTPALATPQGQLASAQSYMVANFQALLAYFISQVDPSTAQGSFQDALGRIYFLSRQAATFATVAATVFGTVGATLPAGSQAVSSVDQSIWATTTAVIYNALNQAPVTFQAVVAGTGPTASSGSLSIYQQVPNWTGITNTAASTPGTPVENRQSFEARRAASVQIGGMGQAANVRAAIANIQGVTDVFVYNNGGNTAITYGTTNYPIPPHSIAINVTAPDVASSVIAAAINSKLDCGCGFSSQETITIDVQDTVNYNAPYPTYPVSFMFNQTPTQLYMTVNVANLSTLPSNYVTLVQQAVAAAFLSGWTSQDGTISVPRARIGGQIVASEYAATILALGNITPVSIFIAETASPSSGTSVTMGIDQQPQLLAANVNVVAVSV
jgi:hypothetical protein